MCLWEIYMTEPDDARGHGFWRDQESDNMLVTDSRLDGPKNIGYWPLKCETSFQRVMKWVVCLFSISMFTVIKI